MANRIKLKGTTENSFGIGLQKQVLDASNLTTERTWILPDSNGSSGNVLTTNGSGGLSWGSVTAGASGTPYFIPVSSTFTVNEYFQALFTMPIDIEGSLVVDGFLCEVD